MRFIDPTGMSYRYVYRHEDKGEGGYYINDNGDRVEWEEVHQWLMAQDYKTDQDEEWGKLSVFANPGNGALSYQMYGKTRFGHSWIKTESNSGEIMTFGTFKKGVVGRTFQINFEKKYYYEELYENQSISMPITNKQRLLIDLFNQEKDNINWSTTYNCTDYSVKLWNEITKDNLYPSSYIRTPTELYNILTKRNLPLKRLPFK